MDIARCTEKRYSYYSAYVAFFTGEYEAKGPSTVLEEYVFSAAVNYPDNEKKKVQMLNRFLDGLLHPVIHLGYGAELGIPGMIIEGKLLALLPDFVFESLLIRPCTDSCAYR